jgi:hypothetical protein
MRRLRTSLALVAAVAAAQGAGAAPYEFAPAPQQTLNRIYRIDRVTGEVISCQYGLQEGTIGVTICFGSGEGARTQTPGEYGLVASRHTNEAGVFRVNYRTGEMSVCYVLEENVVCTPQTGPGPASAAAAAPQPSAPVTPSSAPPIGARPGSTPGQRLQ